MFFLPIWIAFVLWYGRQDDDDRNSITELACVDIFVSHSEQYILLPYTIHACLDSDAASCIVSMYVSIYVYSGYILSCYLGGIALPEITRSPLT